jgi:hypothetical protein
MGTPSRSATVMIISPGDASQVRPSISIWIFSDIVYFRDSGSGLVTMGLGSLAVD